MILWKANYYKKSTETQEFLKKVAIKLNIPMERVLVDGNGMGAVVADNIKCKMFINNATPIDTREEWEIKMGVGEKPNYGNLADQCYFLLANMIEEGNLVIPASVMDDEEFNLLVEELENTVEDMTKDGKRRIIPKKDRKKKL